MENRGSVKEFANYKLSALLLRMVYPSVLSDFASQMDLEEVKERLVRVGYNTGKQFFEIYKVKGKKIKGILREIYKNIWDSKLKIKKIDADKYLLETKNCPICGDLPPLELESLHYCDPIAGFLEAYINELIEIRNIGIGTRKIKVQTLQSKCSSGTKSCVQELIILGEEE